MSADAARRDSWRAYLNAPGLGRITIGYRVLEAYAAGFARAEVAELMGISAGYVSRLASLARPERMDPGQRLRLSRSPAARAKR